MRFCANYFTCLFFSIQLFCLCGRAAAQNTERPQGFAALPVPSLTFSSGEGLEYGGKIFAYQFGNAGRQPYEWHVLCNFSKSTKQKTDFYVFVDLPHVFGPGTRMDLRLEYKKLMNQDFYGLGNQPDYQQGYSRKDDPLFQQSEYNVFQQQWRALLINMQWPLAWPHWRFLGGLGVFYNTIRSYPLPSLLSQTLPAGINGGYSNYLRVGVIYDSRDVEAVPSRGAWSELLVEPVLQPLGNDYGYLRLTAIDRRYFQLHPRLVWAQRILAEAMLGSPPFYEMAVLSNSFQRHEGLGGAKTLRGQPRLLYVGPNKLVINLELRWRLWDVRLLKQQLSCYAHTFTDIGRVWMEQDRFSLRQMHFAEGCGLHVQWKKEFVAVLDIGRSRFQDYAVYLSFGNLF